MKGAFTVGLGSALFRLLFTREEWWLNFRGSISMQHNDPHLLSHSSPPHPPSSQAIGILNSMHFRHYCTSFLYKIHPLKSPPLHCFLLFDLPVDGDFNHIFLAYSSHRLKRIDHLYSSSNLWSWHIAEPISVPTSESS